jgi:hypothetical protein
MPKDNHTPKKISGFTIGRERFGKISAVEGIKPTKAMTKRLEEFERTGLTNAERRQAIIRAHKRG